MPEYTNPLNIIRDNLFSTVSDLLRFVGNEKKKLRFKSSVTNKTAWVQRDEALKAVNQAFLAFSELIDSDEKEPKGFHIWSKSEKKFVGYTTDVDSIHNDSLELCVFYPGTLDEAHDLDKDKALGKTILKRQAYVVEQLNILVEKDS